MLTFACLLFNARLDLITTCGRGQVMGSPTGSRMWLLLSSSSLLHPDSRTHMLVVSQESGCQGGQRCARSLKTLVDMRKVTGSGPTHMLLGNLV